MTCWVKHGALTIHENNQYHKSAVELGKNFLKIYHKPVLEVVNMTSKHRQTQIEENRNKHYHSKHYHLCGRQNFALHGHRDCGSLYSNKQIIQENANNESTEDEKESIEARNNGNFRALLRFRIEATVLKNHMNSAKSNATYNNKNTQNELINACKEKIQKTILDRVKKDQLFSVIFDETTDLSHTSQLPII